MKHDYTALDSAIKAALADGPKKFNALVNTPDINRESVKIAAAHNAGVKYKWDEMPAWRFLDRRLQAMRKKESIVFIDQSRGWCLKEHHN